MSKSLLNLLVQIFKVCQKSEFQIKFENVLFLELGPAWVFVPAAWALAFGRPALPPPPLLLALASQLARPSPSLSLTDAWGPPLHLPPPTAQPRRRRRSLTCALPPPGAPPPSTAIMARALSPLITPRSIPFRNGRLHHHYGAPPPPPVHLRRPAAPLPL
jgi:hypothetical protein